MQALGEEAVEVGVELSSLRRRGRPKGSGCWNKGRSMPKSTRDKISATQKARWKGLSPEQREEKREECRTQQMVKPYPSKRYEVRTRHRSQHLGILPAMQNCI